MKTSGDKPPRAAIVENASGSGATAPETAPRRICAAHDAGQFFLTLDFGAKLNLSAAANLARPQRLLESPRGCSAAMGSMADAPHPDKSFDNFNLPFDIQTSVLRMNALKNVGVLLLNPRWPGFCALVLLLLVAGCRPGDHSAEAASEGVLDLSGQPVDVFSAATNAPVVLLFVSVDCPISNRLVPEIQRLSAKWQAEGVQFRLVYADPDTTAEAAETHLREYQLALPAVRDTRHSLVRRAQATVTPESAVFTPDGRLAYHGRINDQFVDFGTARREPQRHDLDEALSAIQRGVPVTNTFARAVGCYIPKLR